METIKNAQIMLLMVFQRLSTHIDSVPNVSLLLMILSVLEDIIFLIPALRIVCNL